MVLFRHNFVFIFLLVSFAGCKPDLKDPAFPVSDKSTSTEKSTQNLVYRWAEIALEATARDTERFTPRPTVTSRYLGLTFVAVFDAWSSFDSISVPVYLENIAKRPAHEHTQQNKEKAISFAAYRMLCTYYPSDTLLFQDFLKKLGYEPHASGYDLTTPEGIGLMAAQQVLNARMQDGSNQYGDHANGVGEPYDDYSGYTTINTADQNNDLMRWQPKYFIDGKGEKYAPGCLTPFWGHVKPVALRAADQFRSLPPPPLGSKQLEEEVREVVTLQAEMTEEEKALVEFMRDGPASVQQAGHWLKFAMQVSVRDQHTLDEDVKMIMLNQVAAMDAFIACWDTKMHYDFARPYALVHHYFKDQKITGWGGPGKGWVELLGQEWRPYSPDAFLCPAFPAYVSGHSTVSGACAEVLRLFTGDDYFGEKIKWVPGHLTEPDRLGDTVIIDLPTFTETANMAGKSRVLGGYHIQADNVEGLSLGRKVGNEVWRWYLEKVKSEK